jgi:hypothetical protein
MNEKESRTKLEDRTRANAMMAVAAIAAERTWLSGHSQVSRAIAEGVHDAATIIERSSNLVVLQMTAKCVSCTQKPGLRGSQCYANRIRGIHQSVLVAVIALHE